jgi:hypothetical protein
MLTHVIDRNSTQSVAASYRRCPACRNTNIKLGCRQGVWAMIVPVVVIILWSQQIYAVKISRWGCSLSGAVVLQGRKAYTLANNSFSVESVRSATN